MPGSESFEYAEPPAAAMVEALRGIGYNAKTAIADLIDNSLAAGSATVWIDFHWDGADSFVTILDDGRGMSEDELRQAMRPGSRNPLETRHPTDLGRFGLGLKTASFSQCRRLTVASKPASGVVSIRRWDLDYVVAHNEWRLLVGPSDGSATHCDIVSGLDHGTLVLWERLDRLVGEADPADEEAQKRFRELADEVRDHLGMVFHRFLEGSRPTLRVFINGRGHEHRVEAWDPFLENHPATISTPVESIPFGSGQIELRGFVLPHKDKLGEAAHRAASGPAGWNAQQGFYVYRNRRLLVPGSWLDLGWAKEEHYKLARICLDIPNTMDTDWKIDVRKATARPPSAVRKRLKDLAERVRKQAREVFAHRGDGRPRDPRQPLVRAWDPIHRNGRLVYRINRDHPVVAACLTPDDADRPKVSRALRILEETVPVSRIWLDVAEKPESPAQPFEGARDGEVLKMMQQLYTNMRVSQGLSAEIAKARLLLLEPFNAFPHLLDHLAEPNP